MSDGRTLLLQGIELLCKNDKTFKDLIAARNSEIISLLDCYIKEIELFNPAYGLVGVDNTEELIIKHILDSLAPIGILSQLFSSLRACAVRRNAMPPCELLQKIKIADVGSGAGLPGIPLAIALPNCDFTLIERMGRRAGFLFNTIAVLGLSNITIEENEIEKTQSGRFDLITFRAFKPLDPKLLKTLLQTCVPGGIIAAYKGKYEKINEEMAPFQRNWEAIPYKVPFLDDERHLLVIKAE